MVNKLAGLPTKRKKKQNRADPAVQMFFIFWYCVGIIPEIEAVQVLKIKPQTDVMRVVVRFAGQGRKRETTGYGCAVCSDYREQHWLFQSIRIQELRKQLSADNHVYLMFISSRKNYHRLTFLRRCNNRRRYNRCAGYNFRYRSHPLIFKHLTISHNFLRFLFEGGFIAGMNSCVCHNIGYRVAIPSYNRSIGLLAAAYAFHPGARGGGGGRGAT